MDYIRYDLEDESSGSDSEDKNVKKPNVLKKVQALSKKYLKMTSLTTQ